jgi:hypothetical protein
MGTASTDKLQSTRNHKNFSLGDVFFTGIVYLNSIIHMKQLQNNM